MKFKDYVGKPVWPNEGETDMIDPDADIEIDPEDDRKRVIETPTRTLSLWEAQVKMLAPMSLKFKEPFAIVWRKESPESKKILPYLIEETKRKRK